MKFVVNRVHVESLYSQELLQGAEVYINGIKTKSFVRSIFYGWAEGCTEGGYYCVGFTIAEIDDEGYLM